MIESWLMFLFLRNRFGSQLHQKEENVSPETPPVEKQWCRPAPPVCSACLRPLMLCGTAFQSFSLCGPALSLEVSQKMS